MLKSPAVANVAELQALCAVLGCIIGLERSAEVKTLRRKLARPAAVGRTADCGASLQLARGRRWVFSTPAICSKNDPALVTEALDWIRPPDR